MATRNPSDNFGGIRDAGKRSIVSRTEARVTRQSFSEVWVSRNFHQTVDMHRIEMVADEAGDLAEDQQWKNGAQSIHGLIPIKVQQAQCRKKMIRRSRSAVKSL